jgi:hypothetical protein
VKNLLYAHILLDRSGSMESVRDKTVDAVNEYLSGLRADADTDAAVSITLFDCAVGRGIASIDEIVDGVPVATAPKLTLETYQPRGSTPLNEAIFRTVTRMRDQYHRPGERIALVIVTDGLENASRPEYTTGAVKTLLDDVQKDGWLVLYLGANQDAFAEGGARGIAAGASMNFAGQNVGAATMAALRSTMGYARGQSNKEYSFTDEERRKASSGSK